MSLLTCIECGAERSNTAPGGRLANPHAADCPRRGGHLQMLTTMWNRDGTPSSASVVAVCDDGHDYWTGERRALPSLTEQDRLAQADLDAHNLEVHDKPAEPADT